MKGYEAVLKNAKKAVWELYDYDSVKLEFDGMEIMLSGSNLWLRLFKVGDNIDHSGVFLCSDLVDVLCEALEICREARGDRKRWLDLEDESAVIRFVTTKNVEAATGSWDKVPTGIAEKPVPLKVAGEALTPEQVIGLLRAAGVVPARS